MALLLQAAVPDGAAFDKAAWGRFGRAAALRRTTEEVTVAADGHDPATRTSHFRFRHVAQAPDGGIETRWTDTRTCPAARDAIARFAAVPMPRPEPPTMAPRDVVVTADGIDYSVTLPVGYGTSGITAAATFRSNVGTPLAAWVEGSLATLFPCWSLVPLPVR